MHNEPKTIGGLFKDLECELHTLAIAMQAFLAILDEIAKEELDKVIAIENDLSTLESKNKENQYIDKGDTKKDVLEQNKEL